jgi:hypothetical protein
MGSAAAGCSARGGRRRRRPLTTFEVVAQQQLEAKGLQVLGALLDDRHDLEDAVLQVVRHRRWSPENRDGDEPASVFELFELLDREV